MPFTSRTRWGTINRTTAADAQPADGITFKRLDMWRTATADGVKHSVVRWKLPPPEVRLPGAVAEQLAALEQDTDARDQLTRAEQEIRWRIEALDDPARPPADLAAAHRSALNVLKAAEADLIEQTRRTVEVLAEHRDEWLTASVDIVADALDRAADAADAAITARRIAVEANNLAEWLAIRLPEGRASYPSSGVIPSPVDIDFAHKNIAQDADNLRALAEHLRNEAPGT